MLEKTYGHLLTEHLAREAERYGLKLDADRLLSPLRERASSPVEGGNLEPLRKEHALATNEPRRDVLPFEADPVRRKNHSDTGGFIKRRKGFEPSTPSLGSLCSTS